MECQINVSQLLKTSIGTDRGYEVSEDIDNTGGGEVREVKGEISLLRTNRGILVKGVLNTVVELTCSRCLSVFTFPVTLNINEEYIPTVDIDSGAPLPSAREPGSFTIDEHHTIDLGEAIRQYTLLATPIKPLCREDCAGLCANCGHNLNEGGCDCPPLVADPRWSKLSKLP